MIFLGFGLGGVVTGRITDRFGIVVAMAISILFPLHGAYVRPGLSTALWRFVAVLPTDQGSRSSSSHPSRR